MDRDGGKADSRLARAPSDEDGCERHFTGMEGRPTADSPGYATSLRACDTNWDSCADHRPGWLSCRSSSRRLLSIGGMWRKMGSGRHDSLGVRDDVCVGLLNPIDLVDFGDHHIRE